MEITIRLEAPEDYRAVEELTREAFWNLYVPGCDEHYLVNQMRSHRDFIKELAFVAEYDGQIIGSILYTKSWLIDEKGENKEIVSFGPLCVHPDFQRKGVGGRLIKHTADLLKSQGGAGIVIYGDPHNYCKYGFKNGKTYTISDENGEYPYGLLALELQPDGFVGAPWKYQQSDVYEVDQSQLDAFDKSFPPKEKGYSYTQELFSIAIQSYLK